MNLEMAIFIAVVFTTFIAFQLLWDGQFLTYQIFRWLQQENEAVFVRIHQRYVKSLGIPTYLPSSLYLLASGLFLFLRPIEIPFTIPLLINLLNVVIVLNTFIQLVPIHIRIDRQGKASFQDVNRLLRYNTVRFSLISVNTILVIYSLTLLLA